MPRRDPDKINYPPFETEDLRKGIQAFLNQKWTDDIIGQSFSIGNYKWGAYAFFDYDGEPIYVGQTNEQLRTRIRRHLTNQRTDAVAMSVLDPFEVFEVEVWPLPQFQNVSTKSKSSVTYKSAKSYLDALENKVHATALAESQFGAVLNEKDPPPCSLDVPLPRSIRSRIVSEEVFKIRSHPDVRIARRALIISRLAQVISERKVQPGLRRVMLVQAKRLEWLVQRRSEGMEAKVSRKTLA